MPSSGCRGRELTYSIWVFQYIGNVDAVLELFIEYLFIYLFWFFKSRASLFSPDHPGSNAVNQAGLELREHLASAFCVHHHS